MLNRTVSIPSVIVNVLLKCGEGSWKSASLFTVMPIVQVKCCAMLSSALKLQEVLNEMQVQTLVTWSVLLHVYNFWLVFGDSAEDGSSMLLFCLSFPGR